MKKILIALSLLAISSVALASSEEANEFATSIKDRNCTVILDILLERKSEANRLERAAFVEKDEKTSDKYYALYLHADDRVEAVKSLLIKKCFKD